MPKAGESRFEERNRIIVQEREAGRTFASIGLEHGITKNRVKQIVDRARRLEERLARKKRVAEKYGHSAP